MSDQLDRTNRDSLATISAYVTLPYLWIALLAGLFLLLKSRVLIGLPGIAVGGIICLGILTGVVPFFMVRNGIQPFFLNLLGRDMVPVGGCMSGLAAFFLVCFSVLFFIGRDLELAGILFLGAPFFAALVTLVVTLLVRGGIFSSRRSTRPSHVKVEEPQRPALPPPPQRGEISPPPKSDRQMTGSQQSEPAARSGRVPPPRRRG
jgi:hypothetical protein